MSKSEKNQDGFFLIHLFIPDKMAQQRTEERPKIDLAYLLQKYGPKSKKKQDGGDKPPKPEYLAEGFCIKFRLSRAYRHMEKQEIEAAKPTVRFLIEARF